jgi:hypothetical protein
VKHLEVIWDIIQTYLIRIISLQKRNPINVINVEKPLFTDHHLLNMRKLIKEKMLSPMVQTREFTMERNTMNVLTVGRLSSGRHSLPSIREFTLVRNPLSAMCVERPSGIALP